ncbi:hypothetical protein [Cellulosimicrobium sp. Marseille-Q8652]
MATFSAVTRQHILSAIAECDDRGTENFLGVYGFTPSVRETLDHEGRTYDSKAILGVAHKHATGRTATAEELDGSRIDATTILRKHGFGFEAYGPVAHHPVPGRWGGRRRLSQTPVAGGVMKPGGQMGAGLSGSAARRGPGEAGTHLPDVLHDPSGDGRLRQLRLTVPPPGDGLV